MKKAPWWQGLLPGRRLQRGSSALLVAGVVVGLLLAAVLVLPGAMVRKPAGIGRLSGNQQVQAELAFQQTRNAVRTTLVQAVGGALVLLTFAVGLGQLLVPRQGQRVDRFSKAVDQLGNESLDVRLGGIYALAQVAEYADYARPAAEILAAYLKMNVVPRDTHNDTRHGTSAFVSGSDAQGQRVRLRPDLQAALQILVADRLWARSTSSKLDLSYVDVSHSDLSGVDLSAVVLLGAILDGSSLKGASLVNADLRRASFVGADLSGADLSGADLSHSNMSKTWLDRAVFADALLVGANLQQASLRQADLRLSDLTEADLSHADLNSAALDQAVLQAADLSHCYLVGASLYHVRLSDDTKFSDADLNNAVMDDRTMALLQGTRPR